MKEIITNMIVFVGAAIVGAVGLFLMLILTGLVISIPLVVIVNILKLFGIM